MFYIFRLRDEWLKYFVFGEPLSGAYFGLDPTRLYHLAARVPPMGWVSAVGVCQHLHRQLLKTASPLGAGLPPPCELRKDRVLPGGSTQVGMSWWQVYIDNFDEGRVLDVLRSKA